MISLELVKEAPANKYINLDYGIRLNIKDSRANKKMIQLYDASYSADYRVDPEVKDFVDDSLRKYIRDMGFALEADVSTDYMLQIIIKEFHVDYLSGKGWTGTVMLDVEIYDHDRKIVYPRTSATGRFSNYGSPNNFLMLPELSTRLMPVLSKRSTGTESHSSFTVRHPRKTRQTSRLPATALQHLNVSQSTGISKLVRRELTATGE